MKYWRIIKKSFHEWNADKAAQLAASTAYYTVFSLAPLLILTIAVAGIFLDAESVKDSVFLQLNNLVGAQGSAAIEAMVNSSRASPHTLSAAIIGTLVLLLGASGLMIALQDAMNTIWNVAPKHTIHILRILAVKRLLSVSMILTIGFLLLVSLVTSAAIGFVVEILSEQAPALLTILPLVDAGLSLIVITVLFAILFKYLPDIRIRWRDVFPGAFLTAVLFTLGKFLLGFYLGRQDFTATYGIAGSLIVLLLWINYSAQILFFGVEFIKVSAQVHGINVKPKEYAHTLKP